MASEGKLFKEVLGPGWFDLADNIQKRFDHEVEVDEVLAFVGVMSDVSCSFIGKLFAYLTLPSCALIPYSGQGIPVDIKVTVNEDGSKIFKRRSYDFPGKKPFVFRSWMEMSDKGELIEFVGGGFFGMKIRIEATDGNLHFFDDGYFMNVFGLRVPLPALFGPGNTHLIHTDISETEFDIEIVMKHVLFGRMYYQKGRFKHA